jgi:uncharacterized integral membrane protein
MSYKKFFIPFFIILISIIPLLDLFHPGLPLTHDGQDHVARIANFYQNLSEGNIIPRWAGNLNWGYGHPILMFLYPLPSYTTSLFHFLGFSLIDSTKIVFGVAFLLSGLTMYLWIKNLFGVHVGIVAGMLYMLAPYRFVDLYVRGAMGEHVAFIFPPLICYFLYKLSKKNSHLFVVGGGLSVAGLLLSHNAISIMFFPLIFLYALYILWRSKNKMPLAISYMLFAMLGFALSSFFWIPAFFEGKYTLRDIVTTGEYASRYVRLEQFLYGSWSFGGTGEFSVQLGIVHWIMIAGSVALLSLKKTANEHKKFIVGLLIIIAIALFLMISQSSILWQNITLLQKFQFPWRFLSVVVFCSAVLGALVVSGVSKNYKKYVVGIVIFMTLFFSKDYMHAKGYLYKNDSFLSGIYNGTTDTGESSPIWSIRFMEKRPKAHMEIASGDAVIKELSRRTTVHAYEINATEKSRIVENTLYFPGWDVFVDGKKADIEFQDPAHRGLMTFFVDKGNHKVEVRFGETKLRALADLISAAALLIMAALLTPNIKKRFLRR